MKLFSIDVQICGTAYVKASDEQAALEIARAMRGDCLEFSSRHQVIGDDICMDGCSYQGLAENDESVAFSPAMTIDDEQSLKLEDVEFVEELEDAD